MTSLPSALTWTRILIAACIAFAAPRSPSALLTLGVAAAVTDGLDGYLARRWRVAGPAGAMLDLAADGLFFLSCSVRFWLDGVWPGWLVVAVLSGAAPQALAQVVLLSRTGRAGSPGRWWNKLNGGVAYASVLAAMAGLVPVAFGIAQAAVAWSGGVMDLILATRPTPMRTG